MSRRKCSACGHRMGVTHAQYTQCPANVAKNTPVSTDVPTSSIPTVDVQKMSHSSVDSAFMRFQALSVDAVKDNGTLLTLEDLNVLWNLTHGRNIQERLKVVNNAMATADPSTAHEFYLTILEPGLDDNFSLLDSMIESAGPQLFEFIVSVKEYSVL